MNKLLVSIGYSVKMVVPDDADGGLLLSALCRGSIVESHGYGKDEKFTPSTSNNEFSVKRIPESSIVTDDEGIASIELAEVKATLERTQKALVEAHQKLKTPAPSPDFI